MLLTLPFDTHVMQNIKKIIGMRTMTDHQLCRLLKSLNVPVYSPHADELEEAIRSAGMQLPRETWCRKERPRIQPVNSAESAKFSQGTTKMLPPPDISKPAAKRPKLDTENLSQSDDAQHFSAFVRSYKHNHNVSSYLPLLPLLLMTTVTMITTVTTVTNYHRYHCYQLPRLPPLPITTVTTVTNYHGYHRYHCYQLPRLPQLPLLPITTVGNSGNSGNCGNGGNRGNW